MRIIPANFDEMEEKYISGLAKLVHQYKIPPDLVYEQDEINAQFCSDLSQKCDNSGQNCYNCTIKSTSGSEVYSAPRFTLLP